MENKVRVRFSLVFLCVAYFLVISNVTLIIPLLPYLTKSVGLSSGQAQLLIVCFPIIALIANIALGPVIDRYGRKRFIILGAVGSAAVFLVTGLSSDPLHIIAGRAAAGIFVPMIGATIFASIGDFVPLADRPRYSGYVASVSSVAQLISIPVSLLAGQWLSWRAPFLTFSGMFFVLSITAPFLPRPMQDPAVRAQHVRSGTGKPNSLFSNAKLNILIFTYTLFSFSVFCFLALYPSWLLSLGSDDTWQTSVTYVFIAGGVAGFVGAISFGRVSSLFPNPIVLCALISAVMTLFVLPAAYIAPSLAGEAVCYAVFSFGRSMLLPIVMSSSMPLVAGNRRSSLNGLLNASFQLAAAAGGFVGSSLYAATPSFKTVSIMASLLFFICALMCGIGAWRSNRSVVRE